MVCNFWRARQTTIPPPSPGMPAEKIIENDLHARHVWLVGQKNALGPKLEGDPEYFDAKIAGWWVWGMASWIGGSFCGGHGPWQVVEAEDGTRQLVRRERRSAGRLPYQTASQRHRPGRQPRACPPRRPRHHSVATVHDGDAGVNRPVVQLATGVASITPRSGWRQSRWRATATRAQLNGRWHYQQNNRRRNAVETTAEGTADNVGKPGLGECGLLAWMQALSERLRRVRICCGDWTRVCGGKDGDHYAHFFSAGEPCGGVFLDPPLRRHRRPAKSQDLFRRIADRRARRSRDGP